MKTSFKANSKALAEKEGEGIAKMIYRCPLQPRSVSFCGRRRGVLCRYILTLEDHCNRCNVHDDFAVVRNRYI